QMEKAVSIPSTLSLVKDVPPLFVKVVAKGVECTSVAVISGEHDRYAYLERDGEVLLDLPLTASSSGDKTDASKELSSLTLEDIVSFSDSISKEDVPFVLEAVAVNMGISTHSVKGSYGLQVGRTMAEKLGKPKSLEDAFRLGAAYAAAGSDARMSGCSMPVIINSGSGNQGITVTVPVKIVADYLDKSEDGLVRAVCISELVGLVITSRKDRLSALCGAFTAAIGTACAYCYLLGGRVSEMDYCINSMVGNLTGIICDGAKNTCALKIYSCLEAAALSVHLAFRGFAPGKESGIVGENSWASIDMLSRITHEGMEVTDKTILEIMIEKNC
ncbi:MAG: serine dehydratase subunit alpha family protein, partial [Spirochaetales bacterium]|nr:serine dehydratase subunit alpha family protein [Candidatus Physcosoma equi]